MVARKRPKPIQNPIILRGLLDRALANFTCLRGYATMKDLHGISKADESYQRSLITKHHERMVNFLNDEEYLFFPEVILGASLVNGLRNEIYMDDVDDFLKNLDQGKGQSHPFDDFTLRYNTTAYQNPNDARQKNYLKRARLTITNDAFQKFHRIDGNHRLSVLDEPEKLKDDAQRQKFEALNVPFCLVLFPTSADLEKHSRVLFHNLNFHQIPITKEKNLSLILDQGSPFDNEKLRTTFGESYPLARQILDSWDLEMIPHIMAVIEPADGVDKEKECKRTYLINTLELLNKKEVVHDAQRVKAVLGVINPLFENHMMQASPNHGLLTAYTYYAISKPHALRIFHNWVVQNHIYHTESIKAEELIKVFDCVLESRHQTVFVSMQFSPETEGNYEAIQKAIDEVNADNRLDLKIQPIRIDQFKKGYSYEITDEILELIQGCGLLIADLTYGNKNVYHEVGFLMGQNAGKDKPQDNFIFVWNDSASKDKFNKDVSFNLNHKQVLKAKGTGDMTAQLKEQIEIFYQLKVLEI